MSDREMSRSASRMTREQEPATTSAAAGTRTEAAADARDLATLGRQARRTTGAWHRLRRHRLAMLGVAILVVLALLAIGAPLIAREDPYHPEISQYRKGPTAERILG